jgi:hypothetical protein
MMARDKGKKFVGPMGICTCGHTGIGENSQHANGMVYSGTEACRAKGCECLRFKFKQWTKKYQGFLAGRKDG